MHRFAHRDERAGPAVRGGRLAALAATAACLLIAPAGASATVFTVTTTADSGVGSLRAQIEAANAAAGADQIDFGGAGEGTISPLTALPAITDTLNVDGGLNVTLDGASLSAGEAGLQFAADDSQLTGMIITGFPGNGVEVGSGVAGMAVENDVISANGQNGIALAGGTVNASLLGNRIGTDVTGTTAQPNGLDGVLVAGSSHRIGSATPGNGNVISGNGEWGIDVAGGAIADGHQIRGNLIGTSASGTSAVPNGSGGVLIEAGAPGTALGGAQAGQGNLISGNGGSGVRISGSGTTTQGNSIGVDVAGTAPLANQGDGVVAQGTPTGVTIGGAVDNVISGNTGNGVAVEAPGVIVAGNRIGTDPAGGSAIANGLSGVLVAADNVRVGNSGSGNLISGNGSFGIEVDDTADADGAIIEGNRIGTDAAGTGAIPNGPGLGGGGITAREAASIGSATGGDNLISGNDGPGILLAGTDPGQSSRVRSNTIGLDEAGTTAIPNTGDGIEIDPGAVGFETDATIGGAAAADGNLISGNSGSGVDSEGTGVVIQANRIGVAADGVTPAGNGLDGLRLGAAAASHLIGGPNATTANLIANQATGSGIADLSAAGGNEIAANSIFANGVLPIDQLGDTLLNPNDAGDAGPPQNSPALSSVLTNGSRMTVIGTLASAPSKSYVLRLYAAGGAGCTGTDMRTYIGTTTVSTNGAGNAAFNFTLPQALAPGRCVTATATSPAKNTSELGAGSSSATAGTVQVGAPAYAVMEGDGTVAVAITRSGSTAKPVTVHYATIDGSAGAGSDFGTRSGTAVIAAGASSTTVPVPIVDDDPYEANETFQLKIDSPTAAVLGAADAATVTIADDAFAADAGLKLLVGSKLKANKQGVVKVGMENSNRFDVDAKLRILDGSKTIGKASGLLPAAARTTLKAQLSKQARKTLAKRGKLNAKLKLTGRDGDGHERTLTAAVKIVRR